MSGTNIVFPNGDIDPWHALSVLQNLSPSVTAILIHGTAHCADMYVFLSTRTPRAAPLV